MRIAKQTRDIQGSVHLVASAMLGDVRSSGDPLPVTIAQQPALR